MYFAAMFVVIHIISYIIKSSRICNEKIKKMFKNELVPFYTPDTVHVIYYYNVYFIYECTPTYRI